MRKFLQIAFVLLLGFSLRAQQLPIHNQFYINPYLYNPSFVGLSGYKELTLIHKQTMMSAGGAIGSTALAYHMPAGRRTSLGVKLFNDKAGLFSTTSGLITFGYIVPLSSEQTLSFALSGGLASNKLDMSKLNVEDEDDQVVLDSKANTMSPDGNMGVNYQYKGLKLGFVLPRLLGSDVVSKNNFNVEVDNKNRYILMASYRVGSGNISFEPHLLYHHTAKGLPGQIEGIGVIYFKEILWLGASYRQGFGMSASGGFKMGKNLKMGYAYEGGSTQFASAGTHEILLSFSFGKKREIGKKPVRSSRVLDSSTAKEEKEDKTSEEGISEEDNAEEKNAEKKLEKETEGTSTRGSREVSPKKEVEQATKTPATSKTTAKPVKKVVKKTEEYVVFKRRFGSLELKRGNYVVGGVFAIKENAARFKTRLTRKGYDSRLGYSSYSHFYYVYVYSDGDVEQARARRDDLRKGEKIPFWVLIVD